MLGEGKLGSTEQAWEARHSPPPRAGGAKAPVRCQGAMVGDKGRLLPGLWAFSGWGWYSGCLKGITLTLTFRCRKGGREKVRGAGGREGEGTGIGT